MRYSIEQCKEFLIKECKIHKRKNGKWYGVNHTPNQYSRLCFKDFRESIESYTPECKTNAERWYYLLYELSEVPKCYCGLNKKFFKFWHGYTSGCCNIHAQTAFRLNARDYIADLVKSEKYTKPKISKSKLIKFITQKSRLFFCSNTTLINNLEIVKAVLYYTRFIPQRKKPVKRVSEGIYCLLNDIIKVPKCLMCNNHVNYSGTSYRECCSHACARANPAWTAKKMKTSLERYGTTVAANTQINKFKTHILRSKPGYWKAVHDKAKLTCIRRYGVDSSMKVPEFKAKIQAKIKAKYGTETFGGATITKKHPNIGIMYQGSFEKLFIDYWLSSKNKNIRRGPVISYFWNDELHDFIIDFLVEDLEGKEKGLRLIEIKGTHRWFFEEVKNGRLEAKLAAIHLYSQNGYLQPLLILNGKPFTYFESLSLIKQLNSCETDRQILDVVHNHKNPRLYDVKRRGIY